jgi:hydrogenase maturation protease
VSRVLVAGIGNIFMGDDGFGVEVARRLRHESVAEGVIVADFGIRGVHLAYELAGGEYDAAILVDTVARGGSPGTLYAIEPDAAAPIDPQLADAHSLTPDAVLAWLQRIGGGCPRILVVGCEPACMDDAVGLSPAVSAAVDGAAAMVRDLAAQMMSGAPCA